MNLRSRLYNLSSRTRLVILVLIVGLCLGGAFAWHARYSKSVKPASVPVIITSRAYNEPHNLYKLSIPTTWQIQTDIAKPATVDSMVSMAPKAALANYTKVVGNDYLSLVNISTLKSPDEPKVWFTSQNFGTVVVSSDLSVNGYPSYEAKVISADGVTVTDHYVISHNGNLLHFTLNETEPVNGHIQNFGQYVSEYDHMVTSLKFND